MQRSPNWFAPTWPPTTAGSTTAIGTNCTSACRRPHSNCFIPIAGPSACFRRGNRVRRSEERRVGQECVSTRSSRWSLNHSIKTYHRSEHHTNPAHIYTTTHPIPHQNYTHYINTLTTL